MGLILKRNFCFNINGRFNTTYNLNGHTEELGVALKIVFNEFQAASWARHLERD